MYPLHVCLVRGNGGGDFQLNSKGRIPMLSNHNHCRQQQDEQGSCGPACCYIVDTRPVVSLKYAVERPYYRKAAKTKRFRGSVGATLASAPRNGSPVRGFDRCQGWKHKTRVVRSQRGTTLDGGRAT